MRLIDADELIERIKAAPIREKNKVIGLVHTQRTVPRWPDDFYERTSEWHLEHKALGFDDPIADVIEMLMGSSDDADDPTQ